jgi:hypothetical protein
MYSNTWLAHLPPSVMKYQANLVACSVPARRKLRPGLPACAMLQAMVPSKEAADTDPPNQIDIPSDQPASSLCRSESRRRTGTGHPLLSRRGWPYQLARSAGMRLLCHTWFRERSSLSLQDIHAGRCGMPRNALQTVTKGVALT